MASGEELYNTIDCVNTTMREASINCFCLEYPTLLSLYVYELMRKDIDELP